MGFLRKVCRAVARVCHAVTKPFTAAISAVMRPLVKACPALAIAVAVVATMYAGPMFMKAMVAKFPALAGVMTAVSQVKNVVALAQCVEAVASAASGDARGPEGVLGAVMGLAGVLQNPLVGASAGVAALGQGLARVGAVAGFAVSPSVGSGARAVVGLAGLAGLDTEALGTLHKMANVLSAVEAVVQAHRVTDYELFARIANATLAIDDAFIHHFADTDLALGLSQAAGMASAYSRGPKAMYEDAGGRLFDAYERVSQRVGSLGVDMSDLTQQQQRLLVDVEATRGLDRTPRFTRAVLTGDMDGASRLGELAGSGMDQYNTAWRAFHFSGSGASAPFGGPGPRGVFSEYGGATSGVVSPFGGASRPAPPRGTVGHVAGAAGPFRTGSSPLGSAAPLGALDALARHSVRQHLGPQGAGWGGGPLTVRPSPAVTLQPAGWAPGRSAWGPSLPRAVLPGGVQVPWQDHVTSLLHRGVVSSGHGAVFGPVPPPPPPLFPSVARRVDVAQTLLHPPWAWSTPAWSPGGGSAGDVTRQPSAANRAWSTAGDLASHAGRGMSSAVVPVMPDSVLDVRKAVLRNRAPAMAAVPANRVMKVPMLDRVSWDNLKLGHNKYNALPMLATLEALRSPDAVTRLVTKQAQDARAWLRGYARGLWDVGSTFVEVTTPGSVARGPARYHVAGEVTSAAASGLQKVLFATGVVTGVGEVLTAPSGTRMRTLGKVSVALVAPKTANAFVAPEGTVVRTAVTGAAADGVTLATARAAMPIAVRMGTSMVVRAAVAAGVAGSFVPVVGTVGGVVIGVVVGAAVSIVASEVVQRAAGVAYDAVVEGAGAVCTRVQGWFIDMEGNEHPAEVSVVQGGGR